MVVRKMVLIASGCVILFASIFLGCTSVRPGYAADISLSDVGTELRGEKSAVFLFGALPLGGGDYSIKTAAENGGINRVALADIQTTSVLGIVVIRKTIVYGDDGVSSSANTLQNGTAEARTQKMPKSKVLTIPVKTADDAIIDTTWLLGKVEDELRVINLTHDQKLKVQVQVRENQKVEWKNYGERECPYIGYMNNVESPLENKLKRFTQYKFTTSAQLPLKLVATETNGGDLFVYFVSDVENPSIDFSFETDSVLKNPKYLVLKNSTAGSLSLDVYGRKTNDASDAWKIIGVVYLKNKGSSVDLKPLPGENISEYSSFAVIPHNGNKYNYKLEASEHNQSNKSDEIEITISSK